MFCDATFRSPLTGAGKPHPQADTTDGIVLSRAESTKQARYRDVETSGFGKLLVLGVEVGGRWNSTALTLVRALAKHKASHSPPLLRKASQLAWADRWWALLGVTSQRALAASLLAAEGRGLTLSNPADECPPIDAVLDEQRWA